MTFSLNLTRLLERLSDEELPHDFRCTLSLERFRDPWMLVNSGLTYERLHLVRALQERPQVDPQTNAHFVGAPHLAPNVTLKRAVTAWFDEWVFRHSACTSNPSDVRVSGVTAI